MVRNRRKKQRQVEEADQEPSVKRHPKTIREVFPRNTHQREYMEAIEQNIVTISSGPAGSGKAQPLYSKVLTTEGWRIMGDLSPGMWVCTPDRGAARILDVFPQGVREIFRFVFEDGSSTDTCAEHLWKVYNIDWSDKERIISTAEIKRCLELKTKRNRMYIPLPEPIHGEHKDLPLDPYLLGVLLGDGHLSTSTPRLTTSDPSLIEDLNCVLASEGYCFEKIPSQKYEYSLKRIKRQNFPNDFTKRLRDLGLFGRKSYEKFIPEIYLLASEKQRLSLLQGLLDTDGHVGKTRTVSFSSTSRVLAGQVQYLIRSLGGLASLSSRRTSYTHNGEKRTGRESYTVFIRIKNSQRLFTLQRKRERLEGSGQHDGHLRKRIKSITPVGFHAAQCILIDHPGHLYITDDFTVTHNTYLAVYEALRHHWSKVGMKRIVITRPAVEAGEKLGFLPGDLTEKVDPYMRPIYDALYDVLGIALAKEKIERGYIEIAPLAFMRGRTLNNCFVILDEAQNATFEQLKMVITRIGDNCKMVINGDPQQTDLPKNSQNGLRKLIQIVRGVENVAVVEFAREDIVRHRVVMDLVAAFERYEGEHGQS